MEKQTLNLLEVGGKGRSKYEKYQLLNMEAGFNLPPYKLWQVEFIANILQEKKKVSLYLFLFLLWIFLSGIKEQRSNSKKNSTS